MSDRESKPAKNPAPPIRPDTNRPVAKPQHAPKRFDALADEDPQICRSID